MLKLRKIRLGFGLKQSGVGFLQAFLFLPDDRHFSMPHINVITALKAGRPLEPYSSE
jgi:hypothetical protein